MRSRIIIRDILEALEEATLKKIPTIQHAFFTRYGEVSEERYSSKKGRLVLVYFFFVFLTRL